ncbi:MAG: ribosomal protein S19 family protein [Candidatus Aenigmarchaeota archaeon]|nr:ribosomal protein S19 family protein [Candidatus Aenigmarchaeota archaeon]
MAKEFLFRGLNLDKVKALTIDDFIKLLPSRERRTLKRGMSEQQKKLLEKIKRHPDKVHKTHLRSMIILPEMIGIKFGVYKGGSPEGDKTNKWVSVEVKSDMIGYRLGDFSIPLKRVQHSAPGIGASKSTKHSSMKTT